MKVIKFALYGFIAVFILAIALIAFLATTFNPNDYKQEIIDVVKKEKDRTLTIDGDISLSYWPKIGANLGKVAISEHQSDKIFASIDSAKVALAVLPLLKKELVVDTIYIDGANANIVKKADGKTNFEDLTSSDETAEDASSEAIKFDVQGINITNSAINYADEETGATYAISQFNMVSSRIALDTPVDLTTDFLLKANQPAINANINLKGNFLANPDTQHFIAKGLDAVIKGDLLDGKNVEITANGSVDATLSSNNILVDDLTVNAAGDFSGANMQVNLIAPALEVLEDEVTSDEISVALKQVKGSDHFTANLALANMKGSPQAIQSSGITGDIAGVQGPRSINGTFSSPFTGDLEALIFDLPKLVGNLDIKDPALPNGGAKGDFHLKLYADVKQEKVKSDFDLNTDVTKLHGDVAVAGFETPKVNFDLNAGTLDLNQLLGANQPSAETATPEPASNNEPADLSALKSLNLDGKIKIDQLIYDQYKLSGLNVGVLANGNKLSLSGLNVKLDDSKIKGNFSISQFDNPLYTFLIDIDSLDANRYIKSEAAAETNSETSEPSPDAPFDLSALKALNADGSIRIGKFKFDKTKASNIRIDLKAANGVANISPLSARLYDGSTNGSIKIDARNTPVFTINQSLKGVSVGPLLHDAIHNDMLSGTGTVKLNVTSKGNTVGALRKTLAGNAALNLANGAIKGVDIAGTIRSIKSKTNFLRGKSSADADTTKQTDFSELTATFNIKDGVAHNDDLAMKAPVLRLAKGQSHGDIDIGNETIDYVATPTVVATSKGQGGKDLASLNGFSFPVNVKGTFAKPEYKMDYAAIGKQMAQTKLVDKLAGSKSEAVKDVLKGDIKVDTIKSLLGKKSADKAAGDAAGQAAPEKEENLEKKVLKKLFDF